MSGVYVSPSLVLSGDDGGGGVYNADSPIIGWQSILTAGNLAATTEDASYPVTNLLNPATNLRWRATSAALNYLTVTVGGSDPISYVAIAKHNLGSSLIAASVEVDDGGGYDEIVPPALPGDDSPIIFQFEDDSYAGVRLKLAAGDEMPEIGVMYVGRLLTLQRRIYVGHTPMTYGRSATVLNGMSEDGNFLGRIVTNESRDTTVPLKNITPSWYRTNMDPFVQSGIVSPFFFAWRPGTYPSEVGFGWFPNIPRPVNQRINGMMSIDFSIKGVT